MNREKYNQMCDEIGGFLGNHDWDGPMDLVSMAINQQLRNWASYFGAKPRDILKALKRIRREDGVLLDFEIGDEMRIYNLEMEEEVE